MSGENQKSDTAMKSQDLLGYLLFGLSAIIVLPLVAWVLMSPFGSEFVLCVTMLYHFAFLAAVVMLPFMLVGVCLKRTRPRARLWLLVIAVYVPCFLAGVLLERQVWSAGWEAFSERSQPLIAAIEKYERDQGAPPERLATLVPDYLPALPGTGMRACSEYQYVTGPHTREEYAGNPWVLQVIPPVFGVGFDEVLYFPRQNYPQRGYGGSLERIGDWAYVHE